jgi:hypothetical protein
MSLKLVLKKIFILLLGPFVRLIQYFASQIQVPHEHTSISVVSEVKKYFLKDSARFLADNLEGAMLFDSKESLWVFAMSKISVSGGLRLELGVFSGYSINYFASKMSDEIIFGFDSFEGLAEDWEGTDHKKGHFSLDGNLPSVQPNVKLVKGWFDKTIPTWAQKNAEGVAFLHMDADT